MDWPDVLSKRSKSSISPKPKSGDPITEETIKSLVSHLEKNFPSETTGTPARLRGHPRIGWRSRVCVMVYFIVLERTRVADLSQRSCLVGLQRGEEFLRFDRLLREDVGRIAWIGAEVIDLELAVRTFALCLDDVVRRDGVGFGGVAVSSMESCQRHK